MVTDSERIYNAKGNEIKLENKDIFIFQHWNMTHLSSGLLLLSLPHGPEVSFFFGTLELFGGSFGLREPPISPPGRLRAWFSGRWINQKGRGRGVNELHGHQPELASARNLEKMKLQFSQTAVTRLGIRIFSRDIDIVCQVKLQDLTG